MTFFNKPHSANLSRNAGLALAGAMGMLLASTLVPAAAGNEPVIAHESFGAGAQKVLVLHSWMDDAKSFDLIKPYLDTEAFTYVFADLRGYGTSINLEGNYDSREIAADAFRLADSLHWKRFHVVAHSMSGMAAQRMAIDDWASGAKRLKSVVAITPVTADGYPADAETRKFLWDLIHDREMTKQGMMALTGGRLLDRFISQKTERHLATSRPDALRGYYRMWIEEDFSGEAAAARIETPIRVIGGRQDLPGFQEDKYRATFAAWYPNTELRFITDAGHFPMFETPVYLATLVEEFLKANSR